MHFLNPQLLYLAPVFALAAFAAVLLNYWRRVIVQRRFGDWQLLAETSSPLSRARYFARALFAALTVASLLVSLARPIVPNGAKMIAQGSLDVIAMVDVSRSMAAMDYEGLVPASSLPKPMIDPESVKAFRNARRVDIQPLGRAAEEPGSRLEMARHVILDYMLGALNGNQLGVISYAGAAFPQAFLTRDMTALRWVIDRGLTINSAPGEGSAMGKALELSLAMFDADSDPAHERLLVVFSDGGNDDDPSLLSDFAQQARLRHIQVVVVALGNVMPSKIPVSKLAADDDYAQSLRDHGTKWYEYDGQVIKTGMDAALLQGLANQTAGEFVHMQKIEDLNLLRYVGKSSMTSVPGTLELFPWALLSALVFLILTYSVTNKWSFRRSSNE